MAGWGFWDWISFGGLVVAAVMIAIDTAISQSDELKKYFPRILKIKFMGFLPLVALLISASAFIYKQLRTVDFVIPEDAKIGSPFAIIQAWGLDSGAFYVVAKTDSLIKDTKTDRLLLIVRVPFIDRDRMTDANIIKSQIYTINSGFMTLAIPMLGTGNLRVLINRPTPIEYDLVEISFLYSPSQIISLSDVEKLGGKILASTQTSSQFTLPSGPTNPQVVCPPTPAPSAKPKRT